MITTNKQKYISTEAVVLKYLRISRGLSFRMAARVCKISDSAIKLIETGRMNIPKDKLPQMIEAYNYTLQEFNEYIQGRELPVNLKDECIKTLSKFNTIQLQKMSALLSIIDDIEIK